MRTLGLPKDGHSETAYGRITGRLATICFVMMLLIGLSSASVLAQGSDDQSLKGLSAVEVLVGNLPDAAKLLGLSKEVIQADVELKLRLASLRVVTPNESLDVPGGPCLYVNVSVTDGGQAAVVRVELDQNATLARNGVFVVGAKTWDRGRVIARPTADRLRDDVKDLTAQFLNAWLSVNPKR